MSIPGEVAATFSLWIEGVARTMSAPLANIRPLRRIEVVEDEHGVFTMQPGLKARAGSGGMSPCLIEISDGTVVNSLSLEWVAAVRGSVVEVVLQPSRFVFRPLELPNRAAEFLEGIIRAQIDRLTPWSATEAVFRWTRPRDVAGERIELTVVAAGRESVVALARAFSDLGAAGVEISTTAPEQGRVTVFDQRAGGQDGSRRMRFGLTAGLATVGLLAMLSMGASGFIADSYDAQHQQIQRRIAERRAIMRGNQTGTGSSPLELLIRRKQTTPSSVILVEALSSVLPAHTYATELRIEGDKLQIVGVTRDAPSLIQILEQSPHFSSAGFFAPTTRGANEPGERFHIEVRVKPHFGLGT
jgi:general secretion pathway protein L